MLSSLRSPSSFRRDKTSSKEQKHKKGKGGVKEEGEDGQVHTAMSFEEQSNGDGVRCEWVLTNPGAKEEKFEPWISFAQDAAAVTIAAAAAASSSSATQAVRTRQPLNSYNMQRLPAESYPLKEGEWNSNKGGQV